jgi:transposase
VEGTGSYGAGLARFLRGAGVQVGRGGPAQPAGPPAVGQAPARWDAIEAARAALSGRACGAAKTRDGNVEAIRALVADGRSARSAKIQTLNQIRHLGFTTPGQLRQRLAGVPRQHLAARAAALRPGPGPRQPASTGRLRPRIPGRD